MRKMRDDSTWNRLTPEQRETLESWLFDENLGYAKTLERVHKEFGVETTIASVGRFYRRRARERQVEELVEAQATAASQKEMPQLKAYLSVIGDDASLSHDEKIERVRTILFGWDNRARSDVNGHNNGH